MELNTNCQLLNNFSNIGNEEQMTSYELHISVKDYCFGRDDRLVGVSVMQLKDIINQVIINYQLINLCQYQLYFRVPALAGFRLAEEYRWMKQAGQS